MTRKTSYDNGAPAGRIERAARLRWVPLTQMRVNPLAQRELRPARVSRLAAEFDVEQMGTPTVSHRGDWYYLIDGQHRIEALKIWLGTWEDQQIQCWCYEGLSEADEAEVFLKLNDTLTVRCFDRFKVAVQAGRTTEADIDRIVRALGLRISANRGSGGISAAGTLARVYARGGPRSARRSCPYQPTGAGRQLASRRSRVRCCPRAGLPRRWTRPRP